jgi:hypothetical protein
MPLAGAQSARYQHCPVLPSAAQCCPVLPNAACSGSACYPFEARDDHLAPVMIQPAPGHDPAGTSASHPAPVPRTLLLTLQSSAGHHAIAATLQGPRRLLRDAKHQLQPPAAASQARRVHQKQRAVCSHSQSVRRATLTNHTRTVQDATWTRSTRSTGSVRGKPCCNHALTPSKDQRNCESVPAKSH